MKQTQIDTVLRKVAEVLSIVFQPLFAPSMGLFLLFSTDSMYGDFPFKYKALLWVLVFMFTYLLPAIFIFILSKLGVVSSIKLENRNERYLPFGMTLISYVAGIFLLYKFNAPAIVSMIVIGAGVSIVIALSISFFWKISAHMTGIGGLIGSIVVIALHLQQNYTIMLAVAVLFAGLLGFARLEVKAHSLRQVYAGFMLGFFSVFITVAASPLI